jgi:flavin reductase
MPERPLLVGPFPPGTDEERYDRLRRRVLWSMPTGLYLLGTSSGGEMNLMTLSLAIQVSTNPKQVGVAVEETAVSHRLLREGKCFTVSLLSPDDRSVVRKFVKPAAHDAGSATLNGISYSTATTGAPYFSHALAWMDCELRGALEATSHTFFIGEVVNVGGPAEDGDRLDVLRMEDTRMSYGG